MTSQSPACDPQATLARSMSFIIAASSPCSVRRTRGRSGRSAEEPSWERPTSSARRMLATTSSARGRTREGRRTHELPVAVGLAAIAVDFGLDEGGHGRRLGEGRVRMGSRGERGGVCGRGRAGKAVEDFVRPSHLHSVSSASAAPVDQRLPASHQKADDRAGESRRDTVLASANWILRANGADSVGSPSCPFTRRYLPIGAPSRTGDRCS